MSVSSTLFLGAQACPDAALGCIAVCHSTRKRFAESEYVLFGGYEAPEHDRTFFSQSAQAESNSMQHDMRHTQYLIMQKPILHRTVWNARLHCQLPMPPECVTQALSWKPAYLGSRGTLLLIYTTALLKGKFLLTPQCISTQGQKI